MNSHPPTLEHLRDRLLKLEKQNRRFKHLGVAALIVPALLLVMGQAPSKKTVEADEFILRDDNGNVRAKLFMTTKATKTMTLLPGMPPMAMTFNPQPVLALYNEKGESTVQLNGDFITANSFNVHDSPDGKILGMFTAFAGYGAVLSLDNSKGDQRVFMEPGHLEVSDDEGFKAGLGVEKNLVTTRSGETHKTSAASLVLFDKDKNVIWKAP